LNDDVALIVAEIFFQEGAQSLANKVKILQQTYGNDSTDIRRIALVGCGTDAPHAWILQSAG
jgi:hypothetical protein